MLDLIDLFPQTVAVSHLESMTPEVIERAIEFLESSCRKDSAGAQGFARTEDVLENVIFKEVKQEIIALCKAFSEAYSHEVEDIGISDSWGNIFSHGESMRYHKHNNSYICGNFYLSEGSLLNIISTIHGGLFDIMPRIVKEEENIRAWKSFNVRPKPGRIVLFPSGLYHCVLPSKSQEKRYSIAFNAVPLGQIGNTGSRMNIRFL